MPDPNGKNSAAMEARRTKMRLGVQDLDAAADARSAVRADRNGRRASPHETACRAIEAARRDGDEAWPARSIVPVAGPPVCTACHRRKVPIGVASAGSYCDDTCYAYRWSPTPPSRDAFVPLTGTTKQEGDKEP